MKKSRNTPEQVALGLRQAEEGTPPAVTAAKWAGLVKSLA